MSIYAIATFFIVYGITSLVKTDIPGWVTGVVAILAGLFCLADGLRKKG